MGLFISAHVDLTPATGEDPDLEPDVYHVHTIEGLEARIHDIPQGYYRVGRGRVFLRIGYSGYSGWRERLALAVHGMPCEGVWERARLLEDAAATGAPMPALYELIHFADNEGCIGPSVSAKLHRDFVENEALFHARVDRDEDKANLIETYGALRDAFAMAAGRGIVRFH